MTLNELKKYVSNLGFITLKSNKANGIMKKGWLKRYDLNGSFDDFDGFEVDIFTDKLKPRAVICAPNIASASGQPNKAKELLLELITQDLNEGFTLVK